MSARNSYLVGGVIIEMKANAYMAQIKRLAIYLDPRMLELLINSFLVMPKFLNLGLSNQPINELQ